MDAVIEAGVLMHDDSLRSSALPAAPRPARPAPGVAHGREQAWCDQPNDHQFMAMLDAYRDSGGLAACPELLSLCRRHSGADLTTLARWIVERSVVCFEWQSQTWFPMFQFRANEFAPSPRLRPLLTELANAYNAWEVAHWFVIPNLHLGGHRPVSLLDTDLYAVQCVAQAIVPASQRPSSPTASYKPTDLDPIPLSRAQPDHRNT
jgi:hypothetical protein